MPFTVPDNLPFEVENDPDPFSTLYGGKAGNRSILAQAVQTKFTTLEGVTIAGILNRLSLVEAAAERVKVLGTIDTGQGTNTTEFANIPQDYRDLMINWTGVSDGAGEIDSLALRFNGDTADDYVSRLSRNLADGSFMSTDGIGTSFVFSVLRGGYVGTNPDRRSSGTIWIPDYSRTGVTKSVHGISWARGQSGGTNVFNVWAGGTWLGTSAIDHIRIWVSSQLWEVDPHITLTGFGVG